MKEVAGKWDPEAQKEAERILEKMAKEAIDMIRGTGKQEVRAAWYHSHLGSIDFARQIGLISEKRRAELYKQFEKETRSSDEKVPG